MPNYRHRVTLRDAVPGPLKGAFFTCTPFEQKLDLPSLQILVSIQPSVFKKKKMCNYFVQGKLGALPLGPKKQSQ